MQTEEPPKEPITTPEEKESPALTVEQRRSLRGPDNPFWEHRDGLD